MSKDAVIVSAVRTPIGRFQGTLTPLGATKLGSIVVKEALKRANISADIVEEVIMGNVVTAGLGQNPARQAAIWGGVPDRIGAFTINKVCGSGLKAVMLAAQSIKAGDNDVVIAGGMESMSNVPYTVPTARSGARLGHAQLIDTMICDGLWDIYNDYHMGNTAELVSAKYNVTREDQDRFAESSHKKACAAIKEGKFKSEILTVQVPQPKGESILFDTDEGPRADTSVEKLAKLKPAFKKDGTVTAGNSSSINDGAAALVVMSADKAKQLNVKPIARITGYATGGMAPEWVMMAPLEAIKNLEKKTGRKVTDYDLVELNEAFSAAAVALSREMKLDSGRVNVCGGAVALGHPIGCSGARILTTLLYALKDRNLRHGMAALCLGGGNAVALSVEMV